MGTRKKLRAQYDSRRNVWHIAVATTNGSGGWAKFNVDAGKVKRMVYLEREQCDSAIDTIIEHEPDKYIKG